MTRKILVLAAVLLPLCSVGQSKTKASATPSSAQFESQLAAEVCQDFDKQNAAKPFAQLNSAEAMSTLKQSMMEVAMKHPQEMEQLMKASGGDASAAMQAMGQRVAVKLSSDCPVATTLFARLAAAEAAPTATDLQPTDAERPLLERLAADICTDLSAKDAKKPLAKMPKTERMALVQQTMQDQMKAHAADLTKQYGPEFLQDMQRITAMGVKVGGIMASKCPMQVASFTQP